jgi:hypothetical protein
MKVLKIRLETTLNFLERIYERIYQMVNNETDAGISISEALPKNSPLPKI